MSTLTVQTAVCFPAIGEDVAGGDNLEQHNAALGLMSVSSYKLWCRRHGLSMELDKSVSEREAELEFFRQLRGPENPEADRSHCQQRADFIRRIASGELDGEKLSDVMTRIRRLFTEVHHVEGAREALLRLIFHVEYYGNLLRYHHGSRAVPASQRNIVLSGLSSLVSITHTGCARSRNGDLIRGTPPGSSSIWQIICSHSTRCRAL